MIIRSAADGTLFVAAAIAALASGALLAQPDSAISADAAQLRQQIAELRAAGGPNPEGVIDPLRALALLYEESEDHVFAIAALEEARFVTRVHRGLTSVDEALLLRQQIRSEKALGNHQRVWDLEQDMLTIARQHHDDVRTALIFSELADDRLEALEQYRSGEAFPPEIELGCYYAAGPRRYDDTRGTRVAAPDGSCRSGQRDVVITQLGSEIHMYYAEAIAVIIESGDYASEELRDLEKQALRLAPFPTFAPTCWTTSIDELLALPLNGSCLEPILHIGNSVLPNAGGLASIVRLAAYEIRSGAPLATRAHALAEVADWHLLSVPASRRRFDENTAMALALYERVHEELQQAGDAGAAADIFLPALPVTVPTFAPNPFAAAEPADALRYIDVEFDVTKHGRGEHVDVLDTSRDATRAEKRDLVRLIENTTFRPRVVDGTLADAARVAVRYALP